MQQNISIRVIYEEIIFGKEPECIVFYEHESICPDYRFPDHMLKHIKLIFFTRSVLHRFAIMFRPCVSSYFFFVFTSVSILFLSSMVSAKQSYQDSLLSELKTVNDDSIRYQLYVGLNSYYNEVNRDSALFFAERHLLLAQNNHHPMAQASSLDSKGYALMHLGRYSESLTCLQQGLKIAEDPACETDTWSFVADSSPRNRRLITLANIHHEMGHLMMRVDNREQQMFHYNEAERIILETNDSSLLPLVYLNIGNVYKQLGKADSALAFELKGEALARQSGATRYLPVGYMHIGDIYLMKGDKPRAVQYYRKSLLTADQENNFAARVRTCFALTRYFLKEKQKDSSVYYAIEARDGLLRLGPISGTEWNLGIAYENLFRAYELNEVNDSSSKYVRLAMKVKDSLNTSRINSLTAFQRQGFQDQLRLKELQNEKAVAQSRQKMYLLLSGLGIFLVVALIQYRNNKQKQKSNQVLHATLSDLKATQSQLIHAEKMASLGELTAGIAHEIQNPLNFVNNFSEVNLELIAEMKEEMEKGNLEEVKAIADDLADNESKINHHGKRADGIVRGMLQHSRSSSGQKEATDINKLADEYLRLAYHGLRAKDKSFNATLVTDFEPALGTIDVMAQDMGRVLLNLITNAFYAVDEKKKQLSASPNTEGKKYEPTVEVSTKKTDNLLQITVKDNGNGIPQSALDKIFQPFFTTKPTGQGTGLGLSLAYDIVKAHGGELNVNTIEGESTAFVISLPIIAVAL